MPNILVNRLNIGLGSGLRVVCNRNFLTAKGLRIAVGWESNELKSTSRFLTPPCEDLAR